jgi:hypothetical protein
MGKIVRKNNIYAIETRKNLFVLVQSIGNGTLVFFNYFSENIQQFNTIKLCYDNILCYITPVKIFFKKSSIIKINIKPLMDLFNNPAGCLTSLADLADFLQKSAKSAVFQRKLFNN